MIIVLLTLVSCSVLILNHSHGNYITEPVVKPDVEVDYAPGIKIIKKDSIKK